MIKQTTIQLTCFKAFQLRKALVKFPITAEINLRPSKTTSFSLAGGCLIHCKNIYTKYQVNPQCLLEFFELKKFKFQTKILVGIEVLLDIFYIFKQKFILQKNLGKYFLQCSKELAAK